MKNNLRVILILSAALIFNQACRQTESDTANVAESNANSGVEMTLTNMKFGKGSTMDTSPNAASAPYDLQFLDTMTAHHQSAVEMAKAATKSDNAELKAFAAKIISQQEKEIAQMKSWRGKWFAERPPAQNAEMPGIADSLKGLNMKKMQTAGDKNFDLRFLGMMSAHHQGAITMAREALDKSEHEEIKTLANQIIKSQEAEINKMQEWKTAWSK